MPAVSGSVVGAILPSGRSGIRISGLTRMEGTQPPRIVAAMRGQRRLPAAILASALAVAGCLGTGATPPPADVRPDGFPTGVFTKSFVDPGLGSVRLSWVFEPDGDWAEVPEATAGQTLLTGPARGRYVVDGELVTIEVDAPPFWVGWHRHRWRLDGDRLVTTYDDSTNPEDADFFAMLDREPWVRAP
jgi:hypothetical protein